MMRDLSRLRLEIEAIDQKLLNLIADRLDLCREVGYRKMIDRLPAHLPDRVKMTIERWIDSAADRGIDPDFIRRICELVIAEGEKLQQQVLTPTHSE